MTKNNKRLIIFFILLSIFFIMILFNTSFPCLFNKITSLKCPGCGLTRSFLAILKLDFKTSIYYNILGIPLFIILISTYLLLIFDLIKKSNYLLKFWNYLTKKYKIIIVLLIISFIINNIHEI